MIDQSADGYKFEARWHTRTRGSPVEQGDLWVIDRTRLGTASGQQKVQHILTGDGEWTTMSDWQATVKARQNGTATTAQQQLLDTHRYNCGESCCFMVHFNNYIRNYISINFG